MVYLVSFKQYYVNQFLGKAVWCPSERPALPPFLGRMFLSGRIILFSWDISTMPGLLH